MTIEEQHQLDRMEAKLDGVLEYTAGQRERCRIMVDEVAELKRTVYGNGIAGLKTRVDRIEREWRVNLAWISAVATVAGVIVGFLLEWLL